MATDLRLARCTLRLLLYLCWSGHLHNVKFLPISKVANCISNNISSTLSIEVKIIYLLLRTWLVLNLLQMQIVSANKCMNYFVVVDRCHSKTGNNAGYTLISELNIRRCQRCILNLRQAHTTAHSSPTRKCYFSSAFTLGKLINSKIA